MQSHCLSLQASVSDNIYVWLHVSCHYLPVTSPKPAMMSWLKTPDSSDFFMGIKEVKHFDVMQNTCHTNPALNMYFVETSTGQFLFVNSFIIFFLEKKNHYSNQNYTFMYNVIKI